MHKIWYTAEEVQQDQKVTISQSRTPILLYGITGFTAVPQLFSNESVLYMFFAVSNASLSNVPFMNNFLGYHLADLYNQIAMVSSKSCQLLLPPP